MVVADMLNTSALAVGFVPESADGTGSGMTFIGLLYIITHLLYFIFYVSRDRRVRWTATSISLGTLLAWHFFA